jgi:antitoxin (DNA-binding transcriptional repressor) of toxin-antitoxin stability system
MYLQMWVSWAVGMSTVSVREFSYNPSAMFARAEGGETLEITRHGSVIAVLVPGGQEAGRYAALAASGRVVFRPRRGDRGVRWPRYELAAKPSSPDPLEVLLAMRADDER